MLALRVPDRQLCTRLGERWQVKENTQVVGRAAARMSGDHCLARRDLASFGKREQDRLPTGSLCTSEVGDARPVDVHRDRVGIVGILGLGHEVRAARELDVLTAARATRAQERRLVVGFANRADNFVAV